MSKPGRPLLAVDQKCDTPLMVRAPETLAIEIRLYAEYRGETVQEITRRLWRRVIENNPEFRVTENPHA